MGEHSVLVKDCTDSCSLVCPMTFMVPDGYRVGGDLVMGQRSQKPDYIWTETVIWTSSIRSSSQML